MQLREAEALVQRVHKAIQLIHSAGFDSLNDYELLKEIIADIKDNKWVFDKLVDKEMLAGAEGDPVDSTAQARMHSSYSETKEHLAKAANDSLEKEKEYVKGHPPDVPLTDAESVELGTIEEETRQYSALAEEVNCLTGEMKIIRDSVGGWRSMLYRLDGTIDRGFVSPVVLKEWTEREQIDILQEVVAAIIREDNEQLNLTMQECERIRLEYKKLLDQSGKEGRSPIKLSQLT